jgi:hypothetical protein
LASNEGEIAASFLPYVQFIQKTPVYRYEPLNLDDVHRLPDFDEIPEMHDRLIAIVAARLGATILTKDPYLLGSPKVKCLW